MKFLYLTDVHLRTTTPIRRTGSFEHDIMGKVMYALLIAQEHHVDAVVCGGDLFDLPNPSFRLAVRVMHLIASSGIRWFHVLGNHDVIGHNPDSYADGVLAFFAQLPTFDILDKAQFDRFTMKGIHYRHGIEEISQVWETDGENDILVAHAMVTPSPTPFMHVTAGMVETNARLVLLGHYHDPWAMCKVNGELEPHVRQNMADGLAELLTSNDERELVIGEDVLSQVTVFINPGSVARLTALAHNIRRTPRMLMIDTGEPLRIRSIPFSIARESDDAFKLTEVASEKNWESRIEDFIAAMENVRVEGIEAATMVINAAKARAGVDRVDEIPDDQRVILDYALEIVSRVESRGSAGA